MAIRGIIQRGSIIKLQCSPQSGHEQSGYRPAIVVSDGLINPAQHTFAVIVPISNTCFDNPFHLQIPRGISIQDSDQSELTGYVYTDQFKSLDLDHRHAKVVGVLDPNSAFFQTIQNYVRSILA